MRYYKAIVYCEIPQPVTGNQFLKFRNISPERKKLEGFIKFASRFPGAKHINFYDADTRKFKFQEKLQK